MPVLTCALHSCTVAYTRTATQAVRSGREATVNTSLNTHQVTCPAVVCTCEGTETVTVKYGTDRRTGRETATYSPCAPLIAQGWGKGPAAVLWVEPLTQASWQHANGLVSFSV